MILKKYSIILSKFYPIFLVGVVLFVMVCGMISFFLSPLPDFKHPYEGFEARGTKIMGRMTAFNALENEFKLANNILSPPLLGNSKLCPGPDPDPDIGYQKMNLVFQSTSSFSMFTLPMLKSLCLYEDKYLSNPRMDGRHFSLASSLAKLLKKDCLKLNESDVLVGFKAIYSCHGKGADKNACPHDACMFATNAVHYFVDKSFVQRVLQFDNVSIPFLQTTLMSLQTTMNSPFKWENVSAIPKNDFGVKLVAVGDEEHVFDHFMDKVLADLPYFGLAMALMFILLLAYLKSLFLLLVTLFDIIFSLILAYFIYTMVLQIKFFSFLNILSALILIAVCTDDIFLYVDIWNQCLVQFPDASLEKPLCATLGHALKSITVTSLTTAASFFANISSPISAIKCFGLFSGLAILSNLVMMITWIPASVLLRERIIHKVPCKALPCSEKIKKCSANAVEIYFGQALPLFISKAWHILIIFMSILGMLGFIFTFCYPRLKLPNSEMPFFLPSNLLEQWRKYYHKSFSFTEQELTVNLVFGVVGSDGGSYLDPSKTAPLRLHSSFNLSSPRAQQQQLDIWLKLKESKLMKSQSRDNCDFEYFKSSVASDCTNFEKTCCNLTFPVPSELFEDCFTRKFPADMERQNYISNGRRVAYSCYFISSRPSTDEYQVMQKTFKELEDLVSSFNVVDELGEFWATSSDFMFYDLQQNLVTGTWISAIISIAVSFAIVLLTTLNILVTIYALYTIVITIACTIGTLVLLGWELNVIESTTISIAIGLAIDFSIHYGVTYLHSQSLIRKQKVFEVIYTVGPAVLMAALTTFFSGAAVLPTQVAPYNQLGTFLCIVMVFSYLCATFLFISLCYIAGPEGTFCQITLRKGCLTPLNGSAQKKPFKRRARLEHLSNLSEKLKNVKRRFITDGTVGHAMEIESISAVSMQSAYDNAPEAFDNQGFESFESPHSQPYLAMNEISRMSENLEIGRLDSIIGPSANLTEHHLDYGADATFVHQQPQLLSTPAKEGYAKNATRKSRVSYLRSQSLENELSDHQEKQSNQRKMNFLASRSISFDSERAGGREVGDSKIKHKLIPVGVLPSFEPPNLNLYNGMGELCAVEMPREGNGFHKKVPAKVPSDGQRKTQWRKAYRKIASLPAKKNKETANHTEQDGKRVKEFADENVPTESGEKALDPTDVPPPLPKKVPRAILADPGRSPAPNLLSSPGPISPKPILPGKNATGPLTSPMTTHPGISNSSAMLF